MVVLELMERLQKMILVAGSTNQKIEWIELLESNNYFVNILKWIRKRVGGRLLSAVMAVFWRCLPRINDKPSRLALRSVPGSEGFEFSRRCIQRRVIRLFLGDVKMHKPTLSLMSINVTVVC